METLLVGAITVTALYVGSAVFIPLALAVLLAFVLSPAVMSLRRVGLPSTAATLVVVLMFLGSLAAAGAVITGQVGTLIEQLPNYEQILRNKIAALRKTGVASPALDRAGETLKQLRDDLEGPAPSRTTSPSQTVPPDPNLKRNSPDVVPVEIREPPLTPLEQLFAVMQVLIRPLATSGVVFLFLIFILLEREDLRDRAIKLLGSDDLDRSTSALNESSRGLSRYLSTLTMLNITFGVFIAGGLAIIGVPSPVLWGIVAALMRFVPFIGSLIAAAFPILLAAAVDPGWTMVGATFALFAIGEPIMGHIIEPIVQGRAAGLSTLSILVATVFWTSLWGPIGLLLAVPLTLVLVSLGRHLEPLSFFNFILSDQPALSPVERFYQRILAGDADDAAEQAAAQLKEVSLMQYFDDVVRKVLAAAAHDVDQGRLDTSRLSAIGAGVREAITLVADDDAMFERHTLEKATVICIGARSPIDAAGAYVLANLLVEQGISANVLEPEDWRKLADLSPRVVCIGSFARNRRLVRAVRSVKRLQPNAATVVGIWNDRDGDLRFQDEIGASAEIVSTFAGAVTACSRHASPDVDQAA